MTRNQQRALLFVIGLIMMGVSYLQSGRADLTLFRYFGGIAMGLGVFFWLLEHWIWRCPPLYGLLAKPNLSGKWTGSGSETASAENDPLKRTTSTLTADQITFRQTYSSIHIAIKWQSGGESRVHEAAPYVRSGTDTKYLAFVALYTYTHGDESPVVRHATVTIAIAEVAREPKKVSINYATLDRLRAGSISCAKTV